MRVLATISADHTLLWEVALAVGGVVIAVVLALLTLLSRLLADIASGVAALGEVADRLVDESTGAELSATGSSVDQLAEELRAHDELLSRR